MVSSLPGPIVIGTLWKALLETYLSAPKPSISGFENLVFFLLQKKAPD